MKNKDSRLFEEAFFVLREECGEVGEDDMLAEADRILQENLITGRDARGEKKRERGRVVLAFFTGLFLSAVCFFCLWVGGRPLA